MDNFGERRIFGTTIFQIMQSDRHDFLDRRIFRATIFLSDDFSEQRFFETTIFRNDDFSERRIFRATNFQSDEFSERRLFGATAFRRDQFLERRIVYSKHTPRRIANSPNFLFVHALCLWYMYIPLLNYASLLDYFWLLIL